MATSGDLLLATSGDFYMATDTRAPRSVTDAYALQRMSGARHNAQAATAHDRAAALLGATTCGKNAPEPPGRSTGDPVRVS